MFVTIDSIQGAEDPPRPEDNIPANRRMLCRFATTGVYRRTRIAITPLYFFVAD